MFNKPILFLLLCTIACSTKLDKKAKIHVDNVPVIETQKDTIKKPISVKLGKLSASKDEMKEYKSILAKGKKERLFKHKDILKMQYLSTVTPIVIPRVNLL